MKNIVVATDFSSNAYNALFYASKLFADIPVKFHLLHAYEDKKVSDDTNQGLTSRSTAQDGLRETYHRIQRDGSSPNHEFLSLAVEGELVTSLEETIAEKNIDLIVMGNSGCSEIRAIVLGSNVLRVIGSIKTCPILTIPKEIDFNAPKTIAFVTDYKSRIHTGLLKPLGSIARQFDSKIRIMHINEEELFTDEQHLNRGLLLDYFSEFDHSLNWMPLFKSKTTAIHEFLEEMKIDLLAMVNYEHSFLERIGREPVIKRVAFDLDIPFLVIPYQD